MLCSTHVLISAMNYYCTSTKIKGQVSPEDRVQKAFVNLRQVN